MLKNNLKKEEKISFNPFRKLGREWALLTAGNRESFNAMTISWGGFGVLWGKNICFCVVRPQRYTRKFMDKEIYFTLSFFPKRYKKELNLFGTLSGRDTDKVKKTGFNPVFYAIDQISFKEANLVFICKKIYIHDLSIDGFLDKNIPLQNYPKKDFHRLYVGEITDFIKKK